MTWEGGQNATPYTATRLRRDSARYNAGGTCALLTNMKSYFLKLSDREAGPYPEEQVSQFFADGRIDHDTPCRVAPDGPWRTIDDVLPMLKYGTQLPNPTSSVVRSEEPAVYGSAAPPRLPQDRSRAEMRVSVVDFDMPFYSMIKFLFKWMGATIVVGLCFIPVVLFLLFVLMAIFGSLLSGAFSSFPHR